MALCTCSKCDGKGIIRQYGHVKGGICFKCEGAGIVNGRGSTNAERADLKLRRHELIAENERRRAAANSEYQREMKETGGLGSILFAALQRQQQGLAVMKSKDLT